MSLERSPDQPAYPAGATSLTQGIPDAKALWVLVSPGVQGGRLVRTHVIFVFSAAMVLGMDGQFSISKDVMRD